MGYFSKVLFSTVATAMVMSSSPVLANDLDRLLRDGRCQDCYIDGGSLAGLTLDISLIENSTLLNLDFSGATVTIRSMKNVSISAANFDGAYFRVDFGRDFSITDASLRSSIFVLGDIGRAAFERVDMTSAHVDAHMVHDTYWIDGQSQGATYTFDSLTKSRFERWNGDASQFDITGDMTTMAEVSCRSCDFTFNALDTRPQARWSTMAVGKSDFSSSRMVSGARANFSFHSGTRLDGAMVNGRNCRANSIDTCK